jgi:hypothetical protein
LVVLEEVAVVMTLALQLQHLTEVVLVVLVVLERLVLQILEVGLEEVVVLQPMPLEVLV